MPMLAGAARRFGTARGHPDRMQEIRKIRIVPLRVATDHFLDDESPDPRGKEVIGADGVDRRHRFRHMD